MNTFAARMAAAKAHEDAVAKEVARRGWFVEPFGQGQLSERMRDALKTIRTPLRWLPDLIAARRVGYRWDVCLIDAKTGRTDTPNYDIEVASVDALSVVAKVWDVPAWYVMSDLRVIRPEQIREHGWHGPKSGNGSGTTYYLVPKIYAVAFDSVFGSPGRPENN